MLTLRFSNVHCGGFALLQRHGQNRSIQRPFLVAAALFLLPLAAKATALSTALPTLAQIHQKMSGMAVPFEANQGQFAPEVAFAARTFAGTLFVTRNGKIVHALAGKSEQEKKRWQKKFAQQSNDPTDADSTLENRTGTSQTPRGPSWSLVESLQEAGKLAPSGSQPSATHVSRFTAGVLPNQNSNIATFDRVYLGEAWPGITVELAARGNNVEKLYTVAPGSDPKTIRMVVKGASSLRSGTDGSLIAATGNGNVAFTPPVAFQQIDRARVQVPVHYVLLAENVYRFELGAYDHSQPLVIDPLLQSTYLGGNIVDYGSVLAVDGGGNVLIAGSTSSPNFPGTAGGAQPANGSIANYDAFVARLSSNLTTLVQATYIGGSGYDRAFAMALEGNGNIVIAGATDSTNFPATEGGAQSIKSGVRDVFVARLSSNLTTLVQATYLGGNTTDFAFSVVVDAGGNILVAGLTDSTNFPGTTGGAQPSNGGGLDDAFVARLSNSLTSLVQATYLGGNGYDAVTSLVVDSGGNVLVAGQTDSTNFPATSGGAQSSIGSTISYDAFVARLSGNLATLSQSTYLGGSASDGANAIKLDAAGNVLIAGVTYSTNFPGTGTGAQLASGGGFFDAFIARLSSSLSTLTRATYLGGSGSDQVAAIALDASGNVFVAGSTTSTNFPGNVGGAQTANGGGTNDAFVAKLSSDLTARGQGTYLGGSADDQANALAFDFGGNVVVAGSTRSTNVPGSSGGAQPGNGGVTNAFVAKLTADLQGVHDPIFANGFQ